MFDDLLDRLPAAECVGPMVRVADIPENYMRFKRVKNRHIEQFWHMQPEIIPSRFGELAPTRARIGTAFAIHRENSPFGRLKCGLRVYHPFEARHLDRYPEEWQPAYHHASSAAIPHWNYAAQFAVASEENLRFTAYTIVETGEDGRLMVRRWPIWS